MDKTILLLTPGFPADENETATVPYLQDYAKALIQAIGAAKIKIIAIHYPFRKKPYYWHGVEVIPLNGRNRKNFFRVYTHVKAGMIIRKITKRADCILHSFWLTDAAFIGGMQSKRSGSRHIATIMGQDAKPSNNVMQYLNFNEIITVALSQNQARIFEESTGRQPNHIIPFGIEPADQSKMKATRDIDILFVGSLISLKHPELFVDVIKQLCQDAVNLKAVMIGEGPLKMEIQQKINELGLQNNITVTGKLSRDEVYNHMGRSKVLLHTSEFEGQCVVFTEALAYGMYVVSFNVGDIENTEKHIVCSTVEEMNIQIYKLLGSKLIFNSFQPFTNEATVNRYLDLYQA